ncbi:hypothetical protein Agub_g4425 [Astrephomene gubernaculifera]|uniref:Uncharacterized protein n=1 Tax=Astrephomene gubernaculifera TaxID=47775 RepID=A0AAD3HJ79_9CHLO|nr:hypothetical protein Agub_g4425 [Astrephomene gubernaculifera]
MHQQRPVGMRPVAALFPSLASAASPAHVGGYCNPILLDTLADAATAQVEELNPQGLSTLLWSLARAQHHHGPLTSAVCRLAAPRLRAFSDMQLSNLMWALGMLKCQERQLLVRAARVLAARVRLRRQQQAQGQLQQAQQGGQQQAQQQQGRLAQERLQQRRPLATAGPAARGATGQHPPPQQQQQQQQQLGSLSQRDEDSARTEGGQQQQQQEQQLDLPAAGVACTGPPHGAVHGREPQQQRQEAQELVSADGGSSCGAVSGAMTSRVRHPRHEGETAGTQWHPPPASSDENDTPLAAQPQALEPLPCSVHANSSSSSTHSSCEGTPSASSSGVGDGADRPHQDSTVSAAAAAPATAAVATTPPRSTPSSSPPPVTAANAARDSPPALPDTSLRQRILQSIRPHRLQHDSQLPQLQAPRPPPRNPCSSTATAATAPRSPASRSYFGSNFDDDDDDDDVTSVRLVHRGDVDTISSTTSVRRRTATSAYDIHATEDDSVSTAFGTAGDAAPSPLDHAKSMAKLLWSFAQCGMYNPNLYRMLTQELRPLLHLLTPHEITQVLWALSYYGHRCPDLLDAAAAAVMARLPSFCAWDGAGVAWAYGKLAHPRRDLMLALQHHAAVMVPYRRPCLYRLAWACAQLQVPLSEPLVRQLQALRYEDAAAAAAAGGGAAEAVTAQGTAVSPAKVPAAAAGGTSVLRDVQQQR